MLALPAQPAGVAWPSRRWPTAPLDPSVDAERLEALLAEPFSEAGEARLGQTHAILVVQRGAIVAERYGQESGPDLHAAVGVLVGQGKLDVQAPADVPRWRDDDDPRREISLDCLLRMSSGLRWVEDYVDDDVSNVIDMLFKTGKTDVGGYAEAQQPAAPPDRQWLYSSGTSNIVAKIVGRTLGGGVARYRAFLERELFGPLGMQSASARFDEAGTWIGSSFVFATARDFARFGLLYLRDGCWESGRLLPEGWVDYARTPTPHSQGFYGAHWWLNPGDPLGTFYASGYATQRVLVLPALDLLLVRLGVSLEERETWVCDQLSEIVRCFVPGGSWQGLLPRP
jgi:CubicO group peptidase (beta-lactamase class C family)